MHRNLLPEYLLARINSYKLFKKGFSFLFGWLVFCSNPGRAEKPC